MGHTHSVYDTDNHFKVNGITRAITNVSTSKVSVVQFDHNSERFTFEMPRFVEGHDMMLCNSVQVHYANVSGNRIERNDGIYEVDDLQTSPEDESIVICSWLISQNATQIVGSLLFLLRFVCSTDGEVDYAWHTAVYSGISVSNGMNNTGEIVDTYPDIVEEMLARIAELEEQSGLPARPGTNYGVYWLDDTYKLNINGEGIGKCLGSIGVTSEEISISAREKNGAKARLLKLYHDGHAKVQNSLKVVDTDGEEYAIYGEHNTHNHTANEITSGTLSSSRLPTVPITRGGTGATTVAAARKNLGAVTMDEVKAYVDAYIAEALGGEY